LKTDNTSSKNLWALSTFAAAIGDGAAGFTADDHESFRRQEFSFASLNLLLIGALLALQALSKYVRGKPTAAVVIVLAVGFAIQAAYIVWLRTTGATSSRGKQRFLTYWSLGFNSTLALVLTLLTIKGDSAYYALMLVPILEAAFRLDLRATLTVVMLADIITFMGAYGLKFGEYIEAGALAVIYSVMGALVWLLVNNLRAREASFVRNLEELEHTRKQLLVDEKLAAIGQLSRAIAHEIRNPVAMISSSLATATRAGQDEAEREEMFAIAAKEAQRLERLTTDFLVYARPRPVQVARVNLADTLNYVATVARAHAANEGVTIDVAVDNSLEGEFDANQMHQALLNPIDACHRGDLVKLNAQRNGNGRIRIDVVDPAGPIPAETVEHIFEPLFTTKQGGNGLGLAIARNIARAHGSDIVLRINEPQQVCFSLEIPAAHNLADRNGHGENTDRR
jgi:two-component system, NtrC family, sensor histidine kinase HydH